MKEEEELLREAIVIREERKKYVIEIRQRKVEIGMGVSSDTTFSFFSHLRALVFFFCAFDCPTLLSLNLQSELEGAGVDFYQGIES